MPDRPPSDFDSESDWTSYCVPFMMDEGMEQDQAVAACMQMWRDKSLPLADRAWSMLTVKAINNDKRIIEGVASTPSVDRLGDIVEPLGAKFTLPMPLLWQHHHDEPVGQVTSAKANKDGITIKAKFAKIDEPGELKNTIDKAWQAVKAGLVRGLSIGFKPIEYSFLNDGDGIRFSSWSWFELSLVTIPAQAEATITVIKSADLRAALGPSEPRPGATGTKPVNLKRKEREMSKTIQEQIEALESARSAKAARMEAVLTKSAEEGRSTDESEQEEFDTLQREVDQIDGDLKRFRALEKMNLAKAKAVQAKSIEDGAASRGGGSIRVVGPQLPKGIRFARLAKCIGMAKGNLGDAARIVEQLYPDDQGLINVSKSAVMAGTTEDSTWAGPLVGDETSVFADFVEFLRPMTILGKFGTNGVPSLRRVPFRTALITQTTGGTGYWVGQGQAKPLTRADFTRTHLEPLKVANIAVVTEELLRQSSPSAETLLRDTLAAALTARLDSDFIDPAITATAGVRPASITQSATPIASTGVDEAAVRADVMAIMQPFIDADNPPSTGVWVMATSTALALSLMRNALDQVSFPGITMAGGTLFGLPVIVSEYVPTSGGSPNTKYVVLLNASDIYFADDGGISIDMSREASLQMDDAPTMNVGELGSPSAPTATSVVSMFQTNSVAFRAERTVNYLKRRASSVQLLSGVVWGT